MNKTLGLLLILLLLGGVTYYISGIEERPKSTLNSTGQKFAVEKDRVHRIKIDRKDMDNLSFTRVNHGWMLNESFKVNPHTMSHLLNTIEKIDMRYLPYKQSIPTILSDMEKIGIHVSIYDSNDEKITGYTIGSATNKGDANYFLLDGDNQPYAMNVKGFDGAVRDRFNYSLEKWKDKTVFNLKAEEIAQVKVSYPKKKTQSFVMREVEGQMTVEPADDITKRSNSPLNRSAITSYLNSFQNIGAEGYDNRNEKKDSISNLTPFVVFEVESKDGKQYKYSMIPFRDVLDPDFNTRDVAELQKVERYFVTNDVTGDFLVMQQRVFINLLRSYDYFFQ